MIQVAVAVERYGRNAFGGSALGGQFAHQGGHVALVLAGGGFRHLMADKTVDGMATEQGYYALAAYYRLLAQKTSLYDMSDVTVTVTPDQPVTPAKPEKPDTPRTGDESLLVLWMGAAALSGAAVLLMQRKKKRA